MCNLNILYSLENFKNSMLIAEFIQSTTSASFLNNSDGEGFYFNNGNLYKSANKLNAFKYLLDFEESNLIITHQRLATSGLNIKYTHPFLNKKTGFILAHNGILNKYSTPISSDTYNLFIEFNKEFIKHNKQHNREQSIILSIKSLLDETQGSYSIILCDSVEKIIYYFKNNFTDINLFKNHKYLFITTKEKNSLFLTLLNVKFNKVKIKSNRIYKINIQNKDFNIEKIAKIKQSTQVYNYTGLNNAYMSPINGIKENEDIYKKYNLKKVTHKDYITLSDIRKCSLCDEGTYLYDTINKLNICHNCAPSEQEQYFY